MGETPASQLEAALADAGALAVRARKYRRGTAPDAAALMGQVLALGDAARRLRHRAALDAAAALELLGQARLLVARLRALLAEVDRAPEYRAAVAAHRAGDARTLARTLPAVFAGLEAVPAPGDLFVALPWLCRGRLRPVSDLVTEALEVCRRGLAADGDDFSRGADADLQAVALAAEPPAGEPVVLRLAAGSLQAPVHRLVDTGERLVHVSCLRADPAVRLAAELPPGEQLRVELTPADWAPYRLELAAALVREGVAVEDG